MFKWKDWSSEHNTWEYAENKMHLENGAKWMKNFDEGSESYKRLGKLFVNEYEVEEIVDHRIAGVEYYVKWKNFSSEYNSCETRNVLPEEEVFAFERSSFSKKELWEMIDSLRAENEELRKANNIRTDQLINLSM